MQHNERTFIWCYLMADKYDPPKDINHYPNI